MKTKHTLLFITSMIIVMLFPLTSQAQDEDNTSVSDTLIYKQKYGIRLGGDVGRIIRSAVDKDYTGFEINGDYRLSKNLYIAGELGTEQRRIANTFLDVTANGSYFKAGIDYNTYTNWLDMQNMIYTGFRVGVSSFSQTINSFTVYNTDQYWGEQYSDNPGTEIKGLTGIWAELIVGFKAELLPNLYGGLNVQLKSMISQDQPPGFENLYVPGFNRTYDSGRFGIGFGYTISYLIPIYKKDKKVVVEEEN
ncbi:DUF6048 family protein [Psychroserpens algicola]|uniref:DUF6048 family protein n=1 Tax=Psychroserpens algicola TaxID=1719034 RepID=A0ABT0H682_9FLAO|nr:DUF6048 family protein [Psychroserpens algicola]MCK8479884.1 DUF6048 family protein [Psychroserpens algicola]